MTAPRTVPKVKISETDFTKQVLDLARLFGWRTLHLRPGMTRAGKWATQVQGDGVGWPDLFMVRHGRIVAAELKTGKNRATPAQLKWLKALNEARVEARLWRPEDWDQIVELLR